MFKVLFSTFLVSCVFGVILGQKNDITPRKMTTTTERPQVEERTTYLRGETLAVNVKILENEKEANGEIRKTEVLVNFKVTIEEDIVKVNGKYTEVDVVTSYELDADIVYSPTNIKKVPVIVHVLVMRKEVENGYQFILEENVKYIEGKLVEQIYVKLLTIHLTKDGKEYDRTMEMVAFEQSQLKQRKPTKFCHKGDHKPRSYVGPEEPELPDESGIWNEKKEKGICAKFHKLPFAARIAIFVGMVLILFFSVLFCTLCCCRKPTNVYALHKDEKTDIEMEEEAEPLPEKLSFDDKQVLIA